MPYLHGKDDPAVNTRTGNPPQFGPLMKTHIRMTRAAMFALSILVAALAGVAVAVGSAIIVSLIEGNPL